MYRIIGTSITLMGIIGLLRVASEFHRWHTIFISGYSYMKLYFCMTIATLATGILFLAIGAIKSRNQKKKSEKNKEAVSKV